MNKLKIIFKKQTFFLLIVIIVISIVVSILNPNFATANNLFAVFQQITVLGIITMAMSLLLISGGIDLSIGSMMGLSCVIICTMSMNGISTGIAVLTGFLVSVLCGFINGIIVSKSRCMPLIITLGMDYVYYGLALVISQGLFLTLGGEFKFLGRGRIIGIPVPMIIVIVVAILTHFLLKYTKYGRRIVAIGGNEELAFLSGINVDGYKIANYTLSGAISGLAALVLVSRLGNVLANVGSEYALKALAAAIIGGVTFEGGRGTVLGVFLGVILLGVVSNAMNILSVSSYLQTVVLGIIIVVAVVVSNIDTIKS
ncbi:MAG: ABC transporter permease [Clostridia bacterium]|nr:ABC transporter permease [Clostridia bacterium]